MLSTPKLQSAGLFYDIPNYYPGNDYSPLTLAEHADYYHWLRAPLHDLYKLRAAILAHHHNQSPAPDPAVVEGVLWGFDTVIVSARFSSFLRQPAYIF